VAGHLHLDTLWWMAGAETSERGIYRRNCRVRSSRLPSLPQVSRSYDLPPPQCLNSLTPDARRGGPLHPRPRRWCVSSGGYLDCCELLTMDSCHPDHWLGTSIVV